MADPAAQTNTCFVARPSRQQRARVSGQGRHLRVPRVGVNVAEDTVDARRLQLMLAAVACGDAIPSCCAARHGERCQSS
jgi:hypothetical protein